MKPRSIGSAAIAAALLASLPVHADGEPLSATASDRGIGLELASVDQSFEVNGSKVTSDGGLGGVHAYLQRGAAFRAEGRILAGSLSSDSNGRSDSGSTTLADVRATWGAATETDARLYAGIGAQWIAQDAPLGGGGSVDEWSAYVPLGVAKAGPLTPGWRVLVRIEGRFLLTGAQDFSDAPVAGDTKFSRSGGWGLALSARFRNAASGVEIEPFVDYTEPADSDTETVGGNDVHIDNAERGLAGIRFTRRF